MPATSVKVFHSAMNGAPTLSGSAGALLSVLDSCLSDGWGSKTMTTGAISGGVATLNYTSTAAPEVGSVILGHDDMTDTYGLVAKAVDNLQPQLEKLK